MKTKLALLVLLCIGSQAFGAGSQSAKKGGISASTFSDVECSMSDYSCYSLILEQGKQEALGHLLSGGTEPASVILSQAVNVYRQVLAENSSGGASLSDSEIIYILATENLEFSK